jgi:4-hydroxy-tetrahydrodipicolinate synthase
MPRSSSSPASAGVKYALSVPGRARNEMRLPLTPVGEATSAIRRAMVHAGILNA